MYDFALESECKNYVKLSILYVKIVFPLEMADVY